MTSVYKNMLAAAICGLCASGSSLAAETIETVTVTASRSNKPISAIPNTVKVLDREALDQQLAMSSSLLDGLSFTVPSLTPAHQKMTSNGVTLRGRAPLYMADGVPQSTPLRNGERSAFTIDPDFIERVEVIYGANAIQGVGATGGVINYVTTGAPETGEWLRKVNTSLSTDSLRDSGNHYKLSGLVGKKFGQSDFVTGIAYDAQDIYYDADGEMIAVDPVQGDFMDSQSWNLFSKFGYDLDSAQRLEVSANYFNLAGDGDYRVVAGDMAQGIPSTSEKGRGEGDPTENEALNLTLSYTNRDLLGGELSAQTYYYDFYALYGGGTFAAFQDPDIAPVGALFDQSALASEKAGAKLTFIRDNTFWDGLQLVTGIDYLRDNTYQELAQTDRLWVPNMVYQGWAPFVQLEQSLMSDRLRLSAGGRAENVTLKVPSFTTVAGANNTFVEGDAPDFSEVLGNAGVVYDISGNLTLFASFAEGFTMPDAGLILRGVNSPDQTVADLVDLQPVIADNTEIGANYKNGGLEIAGSYFWSDSDFGSRILVVNGVGQITRQKTEIEGLELTASYQFASGLRAGVAYSQLEGRFDSDSDGRLDKDLDGRNIAPDRVNLYIAGALTEQVQGRLQYSSLLDRDFDGGLPQHNFDGYQLVDAVATYRSRELGVFTLGVENLLNESYITYYSQTLTYVNDSTYFAGRGRSLTLSWNKAF
ncbi:TonB-dependent receptor [Microbulbifer bruguierae]|uniref:TonB-dependent receptor n=1 Tax=Microbulbifer bruguierae TaxID=3029061 RepID=A0ABY8NAY1_9GAMM|nr:TonB-dependent receptor [Microbulbifer bruguierae]WGL16073.1 TonB-dependent receptor [Microbulbifer bruguierae]